MVKLAIKGHQIRGKEVIEILEMLGGNNYFKLPGNFDDFYYYIWEDGCIHHAALPTKRLIIFPLEEFLEKYPYKIGDKVNIPQYESEVIIDSIKWDGIDIKYQVYRGYDEEWYTVEELKDYNEIKQENMEKKKTPKTYEEVNRYLLENPVKNAINLLDIEKYLENDGMKLPENITIHSKGIGSIDFIKWYESNQYPKTYEKCCKVLNTHCTISSRPGYKESLIAKFQELLICRDAYWKIAGEKMGLGKSWEPDLTDRSITKYVLTNIGGEIRNEYYGEYNGILAFPTNEMRDVFYDNFEELIKECKELL